MVCKSQPPPTIYPWTRPLGVSFYPKQKTYLIFEIPTIENPRIVISNCLQWFQPPPGPLSTLRAPLMGCGGIRNRKEISYLKSSPLKALNLIYYKIFFSFFFDFCRYGGGSGVFGGRTTSKTYFASNICCKHSPYQFSVKSDNSNSSFR